MFVGVWKAFSVLFLSIAPLFMGSTGEGFEMFGYARLLGRNGLLRAFVGKFGVFLGKSYIGKPQLKPQ